MSQVMQTSEGIPFVRTDDRHFASLPDFDFAPQYMTFEGLRLHYVDEGPRDGPVALLMHGMPTWSFLNRHIMAALVAKGYRCIAADHIGFGRSDKVTDESWYSIARHTAAHRQLIEALDLTGVTLFCQDWGGPISLAQVAAMPQRFDRLVIMNTWLHHQAYDYTPALRTWNAGWKPGGVFGDNVPEKLSIGWFMMVALGHMPAREMFGIVQAGIYPQLDDAAAGIRRAYDAPFADLGRPGVAGPRRFPLSLPFDNPEGGNADGQAADFETLLAWTRPIHFIWGNRDDVFTEAWGRAWAARYPQATFDVVDGAGHFLQDTHGGQVAELFLKAAQG